jgi:hypothetical protein
VFVALGSRHPRHGPAVGSHGLRNRPQREPVRASVAAPALVWAPSIIALLILVIRAARDSVRSWKESKPLILSKTFVAHITVCAQRASSEINCPLQAKEKIRVWGPLYVPKVQQES